VPEIEKDAVENSNMKYPSFSNAQLLTAIDSLLARATRDEALRVELATQQENIYSALDDPSFRDHFGVIEAAVNAHITLSDAIESRAELLDALMGEYGRRIAMAMTASRTFVGRSHQTKRLIQSETITVKTGSER
jgi:hypothetical protein